MSNIAFLAVVASVIRPCQAVVCAMPIGAGHDTFEPGGQCLVELQEPLVIGAGAGQITHLGKQYAAIHIGPRQVGLELEGAVVVL